MEYVNRLSELIIYHGIGEHSIMIVGGAAMAIWNMPERTTVDIDIGFKQQNGLYQCCLAVAKEFWYRKIG